MKYDYLIVGSGLYGATVAHEAKKAGKTVLVVEFVLVFALPRKKQL